MKICILTPRFPFPETGGDTLRINNICRYLKSKGHTLILVSYCSNANTQKQHNIAKQLYDKIYYVKYSRLISFINTILALILNKPMQIGYYFSFAYLSAFKKVIKSEQPDLYISHLIRMVPYLNICRLQHKSIVEMTDALSKTYSLMNNSAGISLKKMIYKIEKRRIAKYERRTINSYKKCVLVSEADKDYFHNESLINKSLHIYTNGIECLHNIKTKYNKNKIVFVGNMRTLQNQDAVHFFVYDIMPIIKKAVPKIVFHIIGAEPPAHIQKLDNGKDIIVSGFVDVVEDEIKDAVLSVAPVRIAAGIQNKVLMSMACGVPVVLTSLISAGIPELVSNKNCYIADNKSDFANAVISLIQNKNMRNKIGKNGYDMVYSEYSWNRRLDGYEGM